MFPINIEKFSDIFNNGFLIIFLVMSAVNAVLLYFSSLKFLLSMQQSGYKGKRYFKWLVSPETPYLSRLMLLSIMGFLFFLVINVCFSPIMERAFIGRGNEISSYLGFISYVLFISVYIKSESSVNAKVPLKRTKRLVRLAVTYLIFLTASSFGFIVLLNYLAYLIGDEIVALFRYSFICATPFLTPFILFLAYGFNEPFEEGLQKHYVKVTANRLSRSKIIKIGITGSFGKTSVKEILNTILSQKFRVLSTPASYNTPLGIAITVKGLDRTHDIFIAEMGARSKGDIKALAKIVRPKYGIITGVNSQHLETFKTLENTMDTKYELIENLANKGVGFFSSDNENAKILSERFGGEKYLAGVHEGFVRAENVKTDSSGMSFNLVIEGEEPIECNTVLLGNHNISNICLASAVCYKLGMSPREIAEGINRIQSIGHRLELVPNNRGITIIDDSYNSNEDGVSAAMDVLSCFKGRRIILTPGLVELGKRENLANFEMGKTLSKNADIVIVIGKHNAEMLISGLKDGGMNTENIIFVKSLNKGNEVLNGMLKKGDVVLFENDLPDNYS